MKKSIRTHVSAFALVAALMAFQAIVWAADAPGMLPYVEGLDALENGKWSDAVNALTLAVEADDENPDFHTALGVSEALSEQLVSAQRELDRANKLRPNHAPTKLWLATAIGMQGRFAEDTSIFPETTRDVYESSVRDMSRKYGEMNFRIASGQGNELGERQRVKSLRDKAMSQFATLAKQFVARAKPAGEAIGGVLKQRGVARFQKRQFAEALDDLEHARRSNPLDAEVLFHVASCKLELGFAEGARADFTAVLTQNGRRGDAYVGRALAHAALGSAERARADFALGQKYDSAAANSRKEEFEKRIAEVANPTTALERAHMLVSMKAAVVKGENAAEISKRAEELVKATHAVRLRADERYQVRLAELREAVSENGSTNADALADLGEYLYNEATSILMEWVEPRSEAKTIRVQTEASLARELTDAERALDQALKINPKQVKALAFKAACDMERRQWADVEVLLKSALAISPQDPVVVDLFSRVMDRAATVASVSAADLRSVKNWSDWNDVYTRYPSQSELRDAKLFESQTARLWEMMAQTALKSAADAAHGTARGFYYQALVAQRTGDGPGALMALESAVKLQPNELSAWRKLAELYGRLGKTQEYYDAQLTAANLTHTTAGPMLRRVWMQFNRNDLNNAGAALERAAEVDPADPRVPAYRGAIARELGHALEAAAWFATAAAINNANVSLNGLRLHHGKGAPLRASDVGFAIQLNLNAGELFLEAGQTDRAASMLNENMMIVQRIEDGERFMPVPSAMIPRALNDPNAIPAAPNIETLMAWTRLRLGQANLKLGRNADAARDFKWVMDYERRKPSMVEVGSAIREPARLAVVEMIKTSLERNDIEDAQRWMLQAPLAGDVPPNVALELQQLRAQIQRADPILQAQRSPGTAENQKQNLMAYRAAIVEQKQAAEKLVNDPSATANIRRLASQALPDWQQKLDDVDKKLKMLEAKKAP